MRVCSAGEKLLSARQRERRERFGGHSGETAQGRQHNTSIARRTQLRLALFDSSLCSSRTH
jgi:hypothetical protein